MASLVVFAAAAFVLLAASVPLSSATLYTVGEARGWIVPPKGADSYNHWSRQYRFRVGDVLEFKYVNDTLLVVNYDGYKKCSMPNPLSRFTDGDTKYTITRIGYTFFISGAQEHCMAGQRLALPARNDSSEAAAPASASVSAPAPAPGPRKVLPPPVVAAHSPAIIAPVTPSSPFTSSPIMSPSPGPGPAQASGASGRALTGFSIAAALLVVCVVTVFILV